MTSSSFWSRYAAGIALVGTTALVVACNPDPGLTRPLASSSLPHDTTGLALAVAKLGLDTVGMVDRGDYFVVEGDITVSKQSLLQHTSKLPLPTDGPSRFPHSAVSLQAVTTTLVSQSNVTHITVDLTQIASSSAWTTAARQAIANWSAIPGTTVQMSEASPGDITVYFDVLDSDHTAAQGEFPAGSPGTVGYRVRINPNYYTSLNASQMQNNMTHELGHNIGFRHTNWQSNPCLFGGSEGAGTDGANTVSGTPSSDAASVMNGCTANNSWAGFSHYDSVAVSVLYHNLSLTESNASGYPSLLATYARGAVSVDLTLEYDHTEWYDHLQAFQTTQNYQLVGFPSSGSSTLDSGHAWGNTECSDWNDYPWPVDRAYYVLHVVYPQRTTFAAISAHVLSNTAPGWSCYG